MTDAFAALLATPAPPCEKGCAHVDACKAQHMACEAFYCYVTGKAGYRGRQPQQEPSPPWYAEVFCEDTKRSHGVSRARYQDLVKAGATPREIEQAMATRKLPLLAAQLGCAVEDLMRLAARWGVRGAA